MKSTFTAATLTALLLSGSALAADEPSMTVTSQTAPASTAAPVPDENGFFSGAEIYVSDNVNALLRANPSPNARSVGVLHPGDQVTFVEYSKDKRYVLIKSVDKTFWMRRNDVQATPAAANRLAAAQQEQERLLGVIADLKNEIENLKSSDAGKELQEMADSLHALEDENDSLKQAVADKDSSIEKLSLEIKAQDGTPESRELSMQMRWWLQGALIALGGAIAGIIFVMLPKPRRKRRERF